MSSHRAYWLGVLGMCLLSAGQALGQSTSQAQRGTAAKPTAPVATVKRAELPAAKVTSRIRGEGRPTTQLVVLEFSAVPHGARAFTIQGLTSGGTQTATLECHQYHHPGVYDCYDCTGYSDNTHVFDCKYLGFCVEGYNGNSSICHF